MLGRFKEEELYINYDFPCLIQESRNNLCAYYVCEFMHVLSSSDRKKDILEELQTHCGRDPWGIGDDESIDATLELGLCRNHSSW